MAKAKKLPSGSWRIRVFIGKDEHGVDKYKSFTDPSKEMVELAAAQYKAGLHKPIAEVTLKEAYSRYIKSKDAILSPSTIRKYKVMERLYLQSIMPLQLRDITAENVQAAFNAEALKLSAKTLKDIRGLFTAVTGVYAPHTRFQITLPQKKPSKTYVPSDDDIKKLLDATSGTEFELVILLGAFGSLRRSEIAALTSADVNTKKNTITVNKAMVRSAENKYVLKGTKNTSSTRTIEMPQIVIDMLAGIEGPIIKTFKLDSLTSKFAKLRDALGLEGMRLHDLRHYQASILHALNVPDKYIMERGGWKTKDTLNRVYQHTMDKKKQEVTKIALDHFNTVMSEETPNSAPDF